MTVSERCLMQFEHLTLCCFLFLLHSDSLSLLNNFPLPLLSFPSSPQRECERKVSYRRENISPVATLLKMSPSPAIHSQRKVGPSGALWLSIDRPILCRSSLNLWVQGHSQAVAGRKWSTALCPTPGLHILSTFSSMTFSEIWGGKLGCLT